MEQEGYLTDLRLPLKKRKVHVKMADEPIDYSLPSRLRATQESRLLACASSPCSSKSSILSDAECEDDQTVPCDGESTLTETQSEPMDLSLKSARSSRRVAEFRERRAALQRCSPVPKGTFEPSSNRVDVLGTLALIYPDLCKPSSSILPFSIFPSKPSTSKVAAQDSSSGEGENYVINPTTGNRCKKNYKNVTVQKRCEANARERTRVHAIAATFARLRALLPCETSAKLSKLAVLRIASAYIQYLGALSGKDFSGRGLSLEECRLALVDALSSDSSTYA